MKNILIIFTFFLATSSYSQKNVLIVGNSLMFYNDLDETLENLFKQNNDSINVDIQAFGGYALRNHLDNYHYGKNNNKSIDFVKFETYKKLGYDIERIKKKYKINLDLDTITKSFLELKLNSKKYDFIIIQEHGNMLSSEILSKYVARKSLSRFLNILNNSSSKNAQLIYFTEFPGKSFYSKKNKVKISENQKSSTIYQTFYDTVTCFKLSSQDSLNHLKGQWKTFLTDSNMSSTDPIEDIDNYIKNLTKLKEITNFKISPTAILFDTIIKTHPNWKMYSLGGHPSKNSSFMFAVVFYSMITDKKLTELPKKLNVSQRKAAEIIKIVSSHDMTRN